MTKRLLPILTFLLALFMALPALATNLYVHADDLNLRAQPSTSAHVLKHLGYRQAVTKLGAPQDGWVHVRTSGGVVGYVSSGFVTLAVPPVRVATHYYTTGPASGRHYRNVDGNLVHSPMHASRAPAGASAICNDGTYSFSQHHRGTCSYHGGVRNWL
jgi:hypothetical protein